jgi:hypothetical protein
VRIGHGEARSIVLAACWNTKTGMFLLANS